MNLFHFSVVALFITLMFSIGSSSSATTDYSHPAFSVADDRALNLRETGSKIVMETMEDAIRQGGLALFDESFQFDSSWNWVFGETIEGEVDAVVPLWSKDGHVVFTQPGLIFWPGIEEENRINGNLGVVYRTSLANTIGINAIGGASFFYDHDFQAGHSRISVGADIQRGYFQGSANYYQPLSDEEEGRTGYIEEAIRGMDARFVYERRKIRLGGNLGYWRYGGDFTEESSWELSYGLDAGIQVLNGIFIEGGYEKHDDASIDDRLNLGVAFRFSLPNFKGHSYGDGSVSSNLYRMADREKRILYEEYEKRPRVWISPLDGVNVEENDTLELSIRLSEALEEDVTINLIGSGTANYGPDYHVSLRDMDCLEITGDSCPVFIRAGQVSASVLIVTNNDEFVREPAETIILSLSVADGGNTGLVPGNSLVVTIAEDPPLPTVSVRTDSFSITEGGMATLTLTLSVEWLEGDATFSLVGGGNAEYGTDKDWHLRFGSTDCDTASFTDPCRVMITAGQKTAEVGVVVNDDETAEGRESFTVSILVHPGSTDSVEVGSPSSVSFVIPSH